MAFQIKCASPDEAARAAAAIQQRLHQSRFFVNVATNVYTRPRRGGKVDLFIMTVRLREAKPYCGNHAGPCQVGAGKHKRARTLEGLDWVAWNDMLNDALDEIEHAGDAGSPRVRIRRDGRRRVEYSGSGHGDWDKDGPYEDWRGKLAPPSRATAGTPGQADWRRS